MYCWVGFLLAVTMVVGQAEGEACYNFMGDSHLEFSPSSLNISPKVHYSLKFRMTEPSGILLYSEGEDDYEALYVDNGKLTYLLANPSPSGVEDTIGGYYQASRVVNDGAWYRVEIWRNWLRPKKAPLTGNEFFTGMEIYDDAGSKLESHSDNFDHHGVVLNPVIYVGGVSSSVAHAGSYIPDFKGTMKEMKEEENDLDFTSYSINFNKVETCS